MTNDILKTHRSLDDLYSDHVYSFFNTFLNTAKYRIFIPSFLNGLVKKYKGKATNSLLFALCDNYIKYLIRNKVADNLDALKHYPSTKLEFDTDTPIVYMDAAPIFPDNDTALPVYWCLSKYPRNLTHTSKRMEFYMLNAFIWYHILLGYDTVHPDMYKYNFYIIFILTCKYYVLTSKNLFAYRYDTLDEFINDFNSTYSNITNDPYFANRVLRFNCYNYINDFHCDVTGIHVVFPEGYADSEKCSISKRVVDNYRHNLSNWYDYSIVNDDAAMFVSKYGQAALDIVRSTSLRKAQARLKDELGISLCPATLSKIKKCIL